MDVALGGLGLTIGVAVIDENFCEYNNYINILEIKLFNIYNQNLKIIILHVFDLNNLYIVYF